MMYLISYQIKLAPGRSIRSIASTAEAIEDEIAEFGTWWRYLQNVWIVDTDMTVDQMTSKLLEHIHKKDFLLIIGIQAPYQGWLPESAWEWLDKAVEDRKLTAAS